MSAVIVGATETHNTAATIDCPFPPGTVAGDTAIIFASTEGGVDPVGWTQLWAAYYGAGNPVYGRGLIRQLSAGDIATGHVTLDIGGKGCASLVAYVGAIDVRVPYVAAQTTDGSPHTVNSDANVLTGDTLLFYAGERDWDDNVWTSGTVLTFSANALGYSNSLMTTDAIADGVSSAQYTTLWGGNKYHAVLAVNSAAPANAKPIIGTMVHTIVTSEFVIPQVYVPSACGQFLQTMPYYIMPFPGD